MYMFLAVARVSSYEEGKSLMFSKNPPSYSHTLWLLESSPTFPSLLGSNSAQDINCSPLPSFPHTPGCRSILIFFHFWKEEVISVCCVSVIRQLLHFSALRGLFYKSLTLCHNHFGSGKSGAEQRQLKWKKLSKRNMAQPGLPLLSLLPQNRGWKQCT